jgi:ankyrin repeat protein
VSRSPRPGSTGADAFDGNLELVKLLIQLGADPTIQDRSYNATPLGWAEHNNQPAVSDYLAQLQAPPQSEPSTT